MDRDVDLLFELGTLRYVDRTWRQFLGADLANVAEHTLRVLWIAMLIAKLEKKGDHEKILKMALVHDATESRTGDVQYLSRQYTERHEHLAVEDMFAATTLKDFESVWKEYERRDSIEAKIVKDADNIDVELELQEQKSRGEAFKKIWGASRRQAVRAKLFTASAKKLWDVIEKTDPHRWHLRGRNRHNAGDWKLKEDESSSK